MTTTHLQDKQAPTDPTEAPWEAEHRPEEKGVAKRTIDQSTQKLRDAKDTISSSANDLVEKAGERYRQTSDAAKRQYQRVSDRASASYEKSKTSVQSSFQKHPLAYVAGTFAVGLAVGLTLPRLRKEKEILAKPGRKLRETAEHVKEKAENAVHSAKDTAAATLEEKGLDPNSVSNSLKDVGEESIDSAKKEFSKE